ncbi:MAG: SPFH domain-containing protein [Planctomycetota bacterium]|jgi:regulator of protease activity HflC (stomatin/prohibitin superfamily)
MSNQSNERTYQSPGSGIAFLLLGILLIASSVASLIVGAINMKRGNAKLGATLLISLPVQIIGAVLVLRGLVVVNPNQAKVVILFGNYRGSLRQDGFWWVNPFSVRRAISLRAHNFNSDHLKVNDLRGNPIEIGAVVVWRVRDTAQAAFDVEDHMSYVEVQTESALRHLASLHPYDTPHDDETSLRGSSESINHELQGELEQRLARAGIEVLEARLSHLAYAPEIAGAMLQRQQAEAIIDARTRIVDGACSMVEMALEQLDKNSVVELDNERKAQMITNLLVVLCSERTQPVVNAGTLYG